MQGYAAFYHLSYKHVRCVFKSEQAGMLSSVLTTPAKLFSSSIQINKTSSFYAKYQSEPQLIQKSQMRFVVSEEAVAWHKNERLSNQSLIHNVSRVKSLLLYFKNTTTGHVCPSQAKACGLQLLSVPIAADRERGETWRERGKLQCMVAQIVFK